MVPFPTLIMNGVHSDSVLKFSLFNNVKSMQISCASHGLCSGDLCKIDLPTQ